MKLLNNQKGMALPLVLVILVVLALLGTALWQYSISELRNVANEGDKAQAFYAARSGAETVARYIKNNPAIADELFDDSSTTVSNIIELGNEYLGEIGDVQVTVNELEEDKIEIISTGFFNGIEQNVSILLELKEFPAPDAVVVTTSANHVEFHRNMTVSGSIVSGGPITLPNSYNTTLYTHVPNYQFPPDYFKRVVVPDNPDVNLANQTIGNNQVYTISGNQHHEITALTVNNGGTLKFDFASSGSDTTAILVVSDLDLKNGSTIQIVGTGKVEIYIRNTATMHGPNITYPSGAQLNFYLAEGCEVSLNGNVQFDGLFYGPYDTHVKMQSNTSVYGAMIVGTLSGQGGNNQIGANGTALTYYEGFGDLEFLPIVNQLHWKPL